MKRHLTASAVGVGIGSDSGVVAGVADRTPTAFNKHTRTQSTSSPPSYLPASASLRTHTLILTGELDYRSAHALEAEIERLCEEGVSAIMLDLRELEYIDPVGVAVIAFRSGLCKRRGHDFALIPGPPSIHRAFEHAGVTGLLAFQEEEDLAAPRFPVLVAGHRSRDACEQ
jgi:anti-anti-sigma factor